MFGPLRSIRIAVGLMATATHVAAVNFSLYAYGKGFEGYPLVFKDDLAYIYSGNISTSTEFTPVTFTPGADRGITTWTANPDNGTAVVNPTVGNATWSNELLYIPSDGGKVGFTSDPSDGQATEVFRFYGAFAMAYVHDTYETPFTAVSSDDGVWQLTWNDTEGTRIVLRNAKPASADSSSKKLKVKREFEIVT